MIDSLNIAFTIALATFLILIFYTLSLFRKTNKEQEGDREKPIIPNEAEKNEIKETKSSNKEKKNVKIAASKTNTKDANKFRHKLLSCSLKAHSDLVTGIDFSPNGKHLISCANDRTIFMWFTKEFESFQHKSVRCNVEFDHAIKVKFSPDSKAFIAGLGISNTIRAFKIVKKDENQTQIIPAAVQDFPQMHKSELISIGLSCSGKFIMSCGSDTTINIWSVKGDLLGSIDTRLMKNSYASVSPCGRFFGACGFTADVKIWEVCFEKNGDFHEIRRAFELKGHSAGVYNFSFNSDSTRMASVSKDGTWRLWNTNIDYSRGQDAQQILSVNLMEKDESLIAISPNSYTVAVVIANKLYFYDALNGHCDQIIENISSEKVNEIAFSVDNKYLAVTCDRHVKIFYNLTGHKVAVRDYEQSLKTSKTEAAKERIKETIDEHKKSIKFIEERSSNED